MDTSYWVDKNKSFKTNFTKKQYFGRYLWRLVYNIHRVYIVNTKYVVNITDHVEQCQAQENLERDFYRMRIGSRWALVDTVLLERVRTVLNAHKDVIKSRTESDMLQIYAKDEQTLKDIAKQIDFDQGLVVLSGPKPGTEAILQGDAIYMPTIPYKFKVVLRDGNYSPELKKSILSQLLAHEDVKIPNALSFLLRKNYSALWGGYFYCNDDSIATFLTLISPGIVGKIHPIINDL